MKTLFVVVNAVEAAFIMVMPIYLYGWKVGLLVASGLTSLLHVVLILKLGRRNAP